MKPLDNQMNSIGGYFSLQLKQGKEYYPDLIKLNTSRNAFEYILRIKKYTKVYIPYFTCDVMLEPLVKLKIPFQFYKINVQLEPIFDFEIGQTECLLYNNYFGLKDVTVKKLSNSIKNLIIDNAQAFFSKPLPNVDTFYSCRKFFGVSDGAYLQINKFEDLHLERDISIHRFSHLLKSIDCGKENSYADFIENEKGLSYNDIRFMSTLTQSILSNIDYEECKAKRIENFNFLHEKLAPFNELNIDFPTSTPAMFYPFLYSKANLKDKLIANKIFVPTFWPNIFNWTNENMLEYKLAENVAYLPIDHRYNLEDIARILKVLNIHSKRRIKTIPPKEEQKIKKPEVYIRPLVLEDAQISYKWRNDKEIWKYTGSKPDRYISKEIEEEWLQNKLIKHNEKRFAICIAENDQYVGNVQLLEIEEKKAWYHIFIGEKEFYGKGISQKATYLILLYAFYGLHLENVMLEVNPLNLVACFVYEKMGFVALGENKTTGFIRMSLSKMGFLDKNKMLA
jgi:RimJ/RimL family protein N-acetyltransferase